MTSQRHLQTEIRERKPCLVEVRASSGDLYHREISRQADRQTDWQTKKARANEDVTFSTGIFTNCLSPDLSYFKEFKQQTDRCITLVLQFFCVDLKLNWQQSMDGCDSHRNIYYRFCGSKKYYLPTKWNNPQNFMQHFNISSFNVSSKSVMLLATGCQKNIHDVCGHEVILLVTDLTSMLPSGGSNDRPG